MDEQSIKENPLPTAPNNNFQNNAPKPKFSISPFFLIVALIIIALSWSIFLYFTFNHHPVVSHSITRKQTVLITPSVTITPQAITPSIAQVPHLVVDIPSIDLASASAEVVDGNVYLVSDSKKQLLVDKNANKNYYLNYPIDFEADEAQLSPDKSKLYITADIGYSFPSIIYINLSQTDKPVEFGPGNQMTWSPNSKYFVYTSGGGDCGPQNINLYLFDTQLNKKSVLADSHVSEVKNNNYDMLTYTILNWLPDSSGIQVKYIAYNAEGCSADLKQVGEGTEVIKIPNS